MFDNVVCRAELPGKPPAFIGPGHVFQTKQFDCELFGYEITEDGRLVCTSRTGDRWKSVEYNPPEAIDFHGDMCFYTGHTADCGGYDFVEYVARFTEGRLTRIREVSRTRTTEGKIVALPVDGSREVRPPWDMPKVDITGGMTSEDFVRDGRGPMPTEEG
jgi:hypothetical protein